ncbi:hypothetical protein [Roseovarius nitratireducens]|nr:hypothetical protein [Roseovarius nitratireducens]
MHGKPVLFIGNLASLIRRSAFACNEVRLLIAILAYQLMHIANEVGYT